MESYLLKRYLLQISTEHYSPAILRVKAATRDGRYYRKGIDIIDTYKSIDTFDTRKKYR